MWGNAVGTIDLGEVLRENDTALEFFGTGICAMREVYDGTIIPPLMPVALGGLVVLVVFVGRGSRVIRGIRVIREVFCSEGQHVVCCAELEVMTVALLQGGLAFPLEQYIIISVVEGALDDGRMIVLGDDDRLVALRLCPVVGIVRMFSRRIGEPKGNSRSPVFEQVALDSGIERILGGIDTGSDFNQFAVCLEGRLNLPVPEMEGLVRGF